MNRPPVAILLSKLTLSVCRCVPAGRAANAVASGNVNRKNWSLTTPRATPLTLTLAPIFTLSSTKVAPATEPSPAWSSNAVE